MSKSRKSRVNNLVGVLPFNKKDYCSVPLGLTLVTAALLMTGCSMKELEPEKPAKVYTLAKMEQKYKEIEEGRSRPKAPDISIQKKKFEKEVKEAFTEIKTYKVKLLKAERAAVAQERKKREQMAAEAAKSDGKDPRLSLADSGTASASVSSPEIINKFY
jgi:hypothetical protein